MHGGETAHILRDLLRIAKLAMPPKLFAEDPRVIRAMALLKLLETGHSPSRPPNASGPSPGFDIAALATRRAVDQSAAGVSFVLDLPWELVNALSLAQMDKVPLEPSDAINVLVREWLTANGYLPLAPSPEETS